MSSALGTKIIGSKAKPGRMVTLEVITDAGPEQVTVEVRSISKAQLGELSQQAGIEVDLEKKTGKGDLQKYFALAIIHSTYEPGTKVRVFTEEQLPDLIAMGAQLDPLQAAVAELMQPPAAPGKSEQTPS